MQELLRKLQLDPGKQLEMMLLKLAPDYHLPVELEVDNPASGPAAKHYCKNDKFTDLQLIKSRKTFRTHRAYLCMLLYFPMYNLSTTPVAYSR